MRLRHFFLLVFLLVALGPLLLFRAWPHSEVLQNELDEVHERHLLLARNLAAALERYHRDLVTTFELFATADASWSYTRSTNNLLENLSFRHICRIDASTGVLLDSLELMSAPCPEVVPTDTLMRLTALAAQEGVAFGAVVAAPSGENVIHMVTEKNAQLVIGAINTSYFRELGEAISFGVLGHAAIIDHTGRALSHPLSDWVATRKDMSKISVVQRMLNRETGVETFYSPALDGDMIAGFTFVDPVGWGVMIPQPIEELYERANDARRSSLIVLGIGTFTALFLAYVVSLRVVRPLEQVSTASVAIAKGDLVSVEPPQAHRFLPIELLELLTQFHEMVTRLRENMKTINGLAYADVLTGLGNRTTMQKIIDNAIAADVKGTLVLVDLDGFKDVNDTHGHDNGDLVLQAVAERLLDIFDAVSATQSPKEGFAGPLSFAATETSIARMGGDEFAVWLPYLSKDRANEMSRDVVDVLNAPISLDGPLVTIGASLGSARYPADAKDRRGLIKAADLALYRAKALGKNNHCLYTPALRKVLDDEYQRAEEIRHGLRNNEFVPHFQPQFRLSDLHPTGVEALARWQHPTRGLLEPSSFLDAAEDIGVIEDIDSVIFHRSVQQITALSQSGHNVGSLAVNVSAARLISEDFLDTLNTLPALPFELRFELMETMLLDQITGHLGWALDRIRECGYQIDLDDFGSAKASVLGLMNVGPSHLKIDKNLILAMDDGHVAERLVRSIVGMAHALDVPVIAEGAENMNVIDRLDRMGCDFVQGFALARPMDIRDLTIFLNEYNNLRSQSYHTP